jgi:hypothetical protein
VADAGPAKYCARCGGQLDPAVPFCRQCGAAGTVAAATASGLPRPLGITILAILQFVSGGLWLLSALIALLIAMFGDVLASAGFVLTAVLLACSALFFAGGLGLWRLQSYGRTIQLVLAWIGLIVIPFGTIISILILVYLFKPGVKVLFSGKAAGALTPEEQAQVAALGRDTTIVVVAAVAVGFVMIIGSVGIVAAIAVPGLMRARMAGNEIAAIATLREIGSGQEIVAATCGNGLYAPSLEILGAPPESAGGEPFIDMELASDPVTRNGYTFAITPGPEDPDSDASCNGSAEGALVDTFFVSAMPDGNATGGRFFGMNQDGTIYESTEPIEVTFTGAPPNAKSID